MALHLQYCTFHTAVNNTPCDTRMALRLVGSSSYDDYGHCCPPVFDPYTLVALLGGVALATYFLRLVIITEPAFQMMMRFKRRVGSSRYFGKLIANCTTDVTEFFNEASDMLVILIY